MKINMPAGSKNIIDILQKNGYEAYIVGGCVRDALLGREPKDWDITTSAEPLEVKNLFKKTIDTGLQHGTVTVLQSDGAYEVTTFRVDGDYLDGRHPESVEFTKSLLEDLKRRDFTINAMAYSEETGLVDEFDGQGDLERRIIRCVGEPRERFSEDALRMMRAVRFSAQLGFEIQEDTARAVKELSDTITKISHERIRDELTKTLVSDNPAHILKFYELGITQHIFPEFDQMMECAQNTKYHKYSVGMHTVKVMENVPATVALRYSALLHDVGKLYTKTTVEGVDHFYGHAAVSEGHAKHFLQDMKFDNATIDTVCRLVRFHDSRVPKTFPSIRRLVNQVGRDHFDELIELMYADLSGKSDYAQMFKPDLDDLERIYREIVANNDCVDLKSLAVNGRDLMAAGVPAGKGLGQMLNRLLEIVMEEPEKNNRETLLEIAKNVM